MCHGGKINHVEDTGSEITDGREALDRCGGQDPEPLEMS